MEDIEKKDKEIKIILVGDSGVGKTNLINVSVGKQFQVYTNASSTCSFSQKKFNYKNKNYTLNLWDTIGQEKLRILNKLFYKNSKIVIYVYDITRENALDGLNYWVGEIKEKLGGKLIFGVCGNKSDLYLKEKVKEADGKKFAADLNAKFKVVSAKNDPYGFIDFLEELTRNYIDNVMPNEDKDDSCKLSKNNKNPNKKDGCC